MHGKKSNIKIDNNSKLFKGLDERINVARYHSLAARKETMPEDLLVTGITDDEEITAVEHRIYPVYGVQFHPESILTEYGKTIIENFLK